MVKKLLWILFLAVVFVACYQLVPIYYRALSLDGICQENADIYHRYNKSYTQQRLIEDLDKIGIPPSNREIAITKQKDGILVEIYYEDTADFFGYYKKDYVFIEECTGVLSSVVAN